MPPPSITWGSMYEHGHGMPEDDGEAFDWYRRSAMSRHASAQASLARLYASGEGVSRDDVEAHAWYSVAIAREAEVESARAMEILRKRVQTRMTTAQVAEAKERAGEIEDLIDALDSLELPLIRPL